MRRYAKLHAGASWIAEYGDPANPEDWEFLKEISAYHTAVPGRPYPTILIATSRCDDRVHPGHARKMAAKLQAMGYEAYFYEPAAGTAMARTTASARRSPPSATISCAARLAGMRDRGRNGEIRRHPRQRPRPCPPSHAAVWLMLGG